MREGWIAVDSRLQDLAPLLRLAALGDEGGAGGVLKDLTDAVVGLGGAFEVLVGANLLADILGLGEETQVR